MRMPSRRDFLKTTSLGIAGLPALEEARAGKSRAPVTREWSPRPLDVPGVHAYPMEHSVTAGSELELCVSASVPYTLSICRLGTTIDDPAGDEVVATFSESAPRPLPIHPGSFVLVERGISGRRKAFTLEAWVRPWSVMAPSGVLAQYHFPDACGFGLFLRPGGAVAFYLGDGGPYCTDCDHVTPTNTVQKGKWHHLVGTFDGKRKALYVDGALVLTRDFGPDFDPSVAPLTLGAHAEKGHIAALLDGDLALPVIHDRALSDEETARRFQDRGRTVPEKGVLAAWPLGEERGDRVSDRSTHERQGKIINHGTWMIGGPAFEAGVSRFGAYDPAGDITRGHALRLASDDLYDCTWPVAHRWRVPNDARSGLHVARFRHVHEGVERLMHCTFLVRRPPTRPRAKILVLAATNTWRAYSGTPFAAAPPADKLQEVFGTGGVGKGANFAAFDLYRNHEAGQGTYQVGLRMPWPAAGPYVLYGGPTQYSHLMRADRFLHAWLEKEKYPFDVISDVDLHREPGVLKGHRVVIINGHNEYWSLSMLKGLEDYLRDGGRLVVLSGNSLFWRVSFNADCTVMECRKVDAPGFQVPPERRGEAWHSHDGLRGGMLRECGHPGWRLVGLDSLGWNNQASLDNFGPYVAEATDHPFFREPEDTGLKPGDKFGWTGAPGVMPMANGHEFDVRPSTLAAMQEQPDPEGTRVPADPPGIVRLANGIIPWSKGGAAFDYYFRPIKPKTDQGGEMIDWQRPDGGRVFNAGSIGAGWALSADPRWAALLRNVLHHFGA